MDKDNFWKVAVKCYTYNHASYIKDTLEGFVMQKTDFPYIAMVVDDASTDGAQDVVADFVNKNFSIDNSAVAYRKETEYAHVVFAQHKVNLNCFIVVLFLKENHYQRKKSYKKIEYLAEWRSKTEYEAICEGDDYWIDPLKLQKQVDVLDKHPDFSMCCSDAVIQTSETVLDWSRYDKNQVMPVEDIVLGGGGFMQTATLLYRSELLLDGKYPEFARKCHVGDYPLQIYAALRGKVFWFAEKQVVYRFEMGNSWTKRYEKFNIDQKLKGWRSEIDMLQGMDQYSNGLYAEIFQKKQIELVHSLLFAYNSNYRVVKMMFGDVIEMFDKGQKFNELLIRLNCPLLARIHNRLRIFISKI